MSPSHWNNRVHSAYTSHSATKMVDMKTKSLFTFGVYSSILLHIWINGEKETPKICRFPKQYEAHRLMANYFKDTEDVVGVDCDRQLVYIKNHAEHTLMLVDLSKDYTYYFIGGMCMTYKKRDDEVYDYCSIPKDAEFLDSVSLGGQERQGWGSVTSAKLHLTTIVTPSGQEDGQCMPFATRLNRDNGIVMAHMFFNVQHGVTDPKLFDKDTTSCVLYNQ